jgi:hypothetical protein
VLVSDNAPYLAEIYLGNAIQADQPDFEPIISFSQETDPKAIQDQGSGEFVFAPIMPGTYALVLWTPVGSTVLREPNSDRFLLFVVEAGETLDVGTIVIP